MRSLLFLGALLVFGCSSDDAPERDGGDSGKLDDGGAHDARLPDPAADADIPNMTDASTGAGGSGSGERPSAFMLEGTAEAMSEDGEARVECRFGAMIDQLVYDDDGGFVGFVNGEAIRNTVMGETGSEFAPLIGGPGSLKANPDGSVELRWVGEQPEDALEFWKELEVLSGTADGDGYAGSWTCGPGLVGDPGFMDIDLSAPGSWTLEPFEP